MSRTVTMFLVSSNRMKRMESERPRPATSRTMKKPITKTSGNVHARCWPEMAQTMVRGIIPIKKLTSPASADETANICGLTYIFVRTPPLLAMDSADCTMPWLKKVLSRIPAIKYGAKRWPVGNREAKTNEKTIQRMKLVSMGLSRVHPMPMALRL